MLRAGHWVARPAFADELPGLMVAARTAADNVLPIGLGRSYGVSGLNAEGALIDMSGLDRFIGFDPNTGLLRAEAGVSIGDMLEVIVPHGFFLPVTPGTRLVTLGGAIANDVHGKNHHETGTFGRWVREIRLLRSDGSLQTLTRDDPSGLFAATIGGLGLTGLITEATLQAMPVKSADIIAEDVRFGGLDEFFALADASAATHSYTVAWIDCVRDGLRGIFSRGSHAAEGQPQTPARQRRVAVPFDAPGSLLNRFSIGAYNAFRYGTAPPRRTGRVPYGRFFYPLDGIGHWNRLYGRRGFYQYQSVVPAAVARDATGEMLLQISRSGQASFLAVLKTFGSLRSPGLLSFPMEGTTLALDFPNRGDSTLALLSRLDSIVRDAGGRLYPAKDGRMSAGMFRAGYGDLDAFTEHVDPAFSSSFWRSVA